MTGGSGARWPSGLIAGLVALIGVLGAVAVNSATDIAGPWPGGLDLIREYPFRAVGVLTVCTVAGSVWAALGRDARRTATDDPVPPVYAAVPDWVIGRPAEFQQLVRGVRRGRTVAVTTALRGAGGFGKTTLASMLGADPRVRRRFRGRVYMITMGREATSPFAIAARVNDLVRLITGEPSGFDDPALAGQRLRAVLAARPRMLVIVDDIWNEDQAAPFSAGHDRTARVLTTRVPSVAPAAVTVLVDTMSEKQAAAVLIWQLPTLDPEVVSHLLGVSGRWPLLLRLINRAVADLIRTGAEPGAAARTVLHRITELGPSAADANGSELDAPEKRARAVRATIDASVTLLPDGAMERLVELGAFAEDEVVPVALVVRLWRHTAGLDEFGARELCLRMADLALVQLHPENGGAITLHDVIRDHLRAASGPHRALVAALAEDLAEPGAWWTLPDTAQYGWRHLVEHLVAAGDPDAATALVGDLRWAVRRMHLFGLGAPTEDLVRVPTGKAGRLLRAYARAIDLLPPSDRPEVRVDTLCSRLRDDPDWADGVARFEATIDRVRLAAVWPMPDHPAPALRSVLRDHTGAVRSVAVSGDGLVAASGGADCHVRVWCTRTGRRLRMLLGHGRSVRAVAASADGTVVVSAGDDGTVRVWALSQQTRVMSRHTGPVLAVAVSNDGSLVVSGGRDRTVRVWSGASGRLIRVLAGHTGPVRSVAVTPDGRLVVSGGDDRVVRCWEVAGGRQLAPLTGHTGAVLAVAVSTDGRVVASGGMDGTVRIWDAEAGILRGSRGGHRSVVHATAVSADGTSIVSGGADGVVRVWDAVTGRQTAEHAGHREAVLAVAMSWDGRLIATGDDGTVRLWEDDAGADGGQQTGGPVTGVATTSAGTIAVADRSGISLRHPGGTENRHLSREPVLCIAGAAAAPRFVTGGADGRIQVWDGVTGRPALTLHGDGGEVVAVAVSADGTRIATGARNGAVCSWNGRTGRLETRHSHGGTPVRALAMSADGTLIVSADGHQFRVWNPAGDSHTFTTGRPTSSVVRNEKGTVTTFTGAPADEDLRAVAVAPDGDWIAAGDAGGAVQIRDARAQVIPLRLAGHTAKVRAIAVSPTGSQIVTGGDDRTIRVWDSGTGQTLTAVRVNSTVTSLTWLPDGTHIVAGGPRGAFLFRLDPAGLSQLDRTVG